MAVKSPEARTPRRRGLAPTLAGCLALACLAGPEAPARAQGTAAAPAAKPAGVKLPDGFVLPPLPPTAPVVTPAPPTLPPALPTPAPVPATAPAPAPEPSPPANAAVAAVAPADPALETVGCSTCNGTGFTHHPGGPAFSSCSTCGGSGCIPGRKPCPPWEAHTFVGRFFGGLYECLCCPDPCYDPQWLPEANAGFFVDFARPRTVQRLRWDRGWGMQFPDRSEYFWARESLSGPIAPARPNGPKFKAGGSGPSAPAALARYQKRHPGTNVRYAGVPSLNFNQLYYYQEAAKGPASAFVEMSYRTVDPINNDWHAGFSNVNIGTKGMFLDCELMQLTFQFVTMLPIGPASKGLSNGHVSLEPSLLAAIRLAPDLYLQGQLAEWIPLGGDTNYQGSILHYHFSLNQVLWRVTPDSPVIGTLEFGGYSFQDGAYTDPFQLFSQFQRSSGTTYFYAGPGLRASICDRVDFGGAVAFPVSDYRLANPWLRIELRILF